MEIKVTDLLAEEVVFFGEAEDYLFECDNDTELEVFLSNFELSRKEMIRYYAENGQPYLIEKVFEEY